MTSVATTTEPEPTRARRRRPALPLLITGLGLVTWAALVAVGRAWGLRLQGEGHDLVLYTPPILGGYRVEHSLWFAVPIVAGGFGVAVLPRLATHLRWRWTLLAGWAGSLAWAIALAAPDGRDGLTRGLEWAADFESALPGVARDPHGFLSTFVEQLPTQSIQIRAHPPGLPLLLALLGRLGLSGPGWAAAVVLVIAATATVAVAITTRELCGETAARAVVPFLALAPAALWIATSFDALYLGVGAWFVTTAVLALRRQTRLWLAFATTAGVLGAVTIELSYGLILLGAIPVAAAWSARRIRPLVVTVAVAAGVTIALAGTGFWWLAGLAGTRDQYEALGLDRPYSYFVVDNLAALALVVGPAVAVALVHLVRRTGQSVDAGVWVMVGGALAAIVAADLSGLSDGEVERIWLPFALWLFPATAVLARSGRPRRGWLVVQAGSAVALTALIRPNW
jgi:hypothetical protein